MNKLIFHFASLERPELVMLQFQSYGRDSRTSVRGKASSINSDYFSFQWTSAVKALTLLGLRGTLFGIDKSWISGESRSLASALDYALSKPPMWLVEMFGEDRHGEALAKRLFKRENPERKRPGPVVINLNSKQFETKDLEIHVAGRKLVDLREIRFVYSEFLRALGAEEFDIEISSKEDSNQGSLISIQTGESDEQYLQNIYEEEIRDSLFTPKVFSKRWTSEFVSHLSKDPLFNKVNSPHPNSLNALLDQGSTSERLAFCNVNDLRRTFSRLPEIRVISSAVTAGFVALSHYIRDVLQIPIDIRIYYPYGVDAVQYSKLFKEESYSICCTGFGPSAEFFSRPSKGYSPIMFGPNMSHRVVKSSMAEAVGESGSEFLFVADSPTSAMFCFDALLKEGKLDKKNVKVTHCEPEDSILSLRDNPEAKSLMWFPHYKLLSYHGAVTVVEDKTSAYSQSTVIFANQTLTKNKTILHQIKLLYRHAWLSMMEDKESIRQVSKIILSDKSYVQFVKRCGGLHYLDAIERNPSALLSVCPFE